MKVQDIILKPIITEKSMDMLPEKRYAFEVAKNATKADIAAAVEEMFGVEVECVRTVNVCGKPKRYGVHAGYKSDWKKAIVSLKKDSKTIAFFDSLN